MTSGKKSRLTIGCRAKILNGTRWGEDYGEYEVLLTERSPNSGFAAIVLCKGVKELEKEKSGIVENQVAWIPESALELIDGDFEANLDFMDWYEGHKDDFCGDCGAWFPGNDGLTGKDPKTGEYLKCPNKDCPSNNLEDYEYFD
jgi:hypothetical protein